jgi:hypothetical protein
MPGYNSNNLLGGTQQAISTSFKTLVSVTASSGTSLQRGKIEEFVFGTDGTPADNAMTCDVSRQTAAGTATAITPTQLDAADGAWLGTATANATAEPTVTANSRVAGWGFNQRATLRWVAAPGQWLVYPATNVAGFAFRLKSPGYTSTAIADVIHSNL